MGTLWTDEIQPRGSQLEDLRRGQQILQEDVIAPLWEAQNDMWAPGGSASIAQALFFRPDAGNRPARESYPGSAERTRCQVAGSLGRLHTLRGAILSALNHKETPTVPYVMWESVEITCCKTGTIRHSM